MVISRRNKLTGKILGLTIKYQREYPEIQQGKKIVGRIALGKRSEFNKKLAKFCVKNQVLLRYLTDTKTPAEKILQAIIDYALKMSEGNRQKAMAFLDNEINEIEKKSEIDYKILENIARKKSLYGKDAEKYIDQTKHMYKIVAVALGGKLEHCKTRIEQMKQ